MKTSNIIILAVFIFIIILSIWNMLVIRDKVKEEFEIKQESLVVEDLSAFRTLVVENYIDLKIAPNKENELKYYKDDSVLFRIYYDTLFVSGKGKVKLKVNTLNTLILKDGAAVFFDDWNEERCVLKMSGWAFFKAKSMHTQNFKLSAFDNNTLRIDDSRIDTLNLDLNNRSSINIKNTKLKSATGMVRNNAILKIPYVEDFTVVKKDDAIVSMD